MTGISKADGNILEKMLEEGQMRVLYCPSDSSRCSVIGNSDHYLMPGVSKSLYEGGDEHDLKRTERTDYR